MPAQQHDAVQAVPLLLCMVTPTPFICNYPSTASQPLNMGFDGFLQLPAAFVCRYTIGNFAQRVFALMVPFVKVGQTGELTLTAVSLFSLIQLVLDAICRWGDMMAKIFLLVFRGYQLAATLPPVA